jgi:D-arabinose 1-dehydrogenase-like Zn-dependent alcohol dehydrogenase
MEIRVLCLDVADGPRNLARPLDIGAQILDARSEKAAEILPQLGAEDGIHYLGDKGVDAVIILPESQAAFDYGMALLKSHSKCVVMPFSEPGSHILSRNIVFRGVSIIGSLVGSNRTFREMLNQSTEPIR